MIREIRSQSFRIECEDDDEDDGLRPEGVRARHSPLVSIRPLCMRLAQ